MAPASIRGHYDGVGIVLDEPAPLEVGQAVRVVVEAARTAGQGPPTRPALGKFAEGVLEQTFTPFVELTATFINGDDWDESAALHVKPLDRVPPDLVRQPGSATGQIRIAADFDAVPDGFEVAP